MANPFAIEPANPMAALMSGVQGFDRAAASTKQAETLAGRQQAMQALQTGGDTRTALARLIGIGDVQGAKAIADFADSQANRSFRETESQRAQSNADRSFGLQERQFGLAQQQAEQAARGFDYREIEGPDGNKVLVRIEKATGRIDQPQIAGQNFVTPSNPYAPAGKQTDEQAKAALYARRMFQAEQVLRDPKVEGVATSVTEQVRGAVGNRVPFGAGRGAMSEDFQRYDQAKRDFVNAVLRRESGAVISDAEFANAEKQYFPAPGDTPKVLQQKRQNREEAIRGITGAAGRSYTPEFIFNEQSGIVPNPRSQAQPQPAPAQPGQRSAPPPAAIEALRANPRLATAFDAKYGIGASARALGVLD